MIPKQLQKPEFRFILIMPKNKGPFEIAWSLTDIQYTRQPDNSWKHKETGEAYIIKKTGKIYYGELHTYTFDNPKLINHIKNGGNYGVLCGPGGLAVLDDDSSDNCLIKLFENLISSSFTVRGHKYMIINDLKSKLILHHPTKTDGKDNPLHLGELQSWGTQVVGPGSVHPSGEIYRIKDNSEIPILSVDTINSTYGTFKKPEIKESIREFKREKWEGDNIQDIPIGSIVSLGSLNNLGDSYQGPHPKHGSENGMNFRVNTLDNTWYCFRCSSGGASAELIAVMEGIISCSESGPRCFTEEQGQEVIRVAREKYGLKLPDITANLEPRGWANSVSILKVSEKYDFKICPNCNKQFQFNDKLGWFKCNCQRGGLKDFVKLIITKSDGGNKMGYNPKNSEEQPTLPPDKIFTGVIIGIKDGKVKDFVKNTEKWTGNIEQAAINLEIEVMHNEKKYNTEQVFTYNEEDGKTVYSQKSNLGKFKAKYNKLPETGDQLKLLTNGEGFLKLKLD